MSGHAEIVRGLLPRALVEDIADFLVWTTNRPDERGQFPLAVRLEPIMRAIPVYLANDPLLHRTLDTKHLRCHWPPMARWVAPGDAAALWAPHRDTEYNSHIDGDFVTVWVPLVPIDEKCGGLTVGWGLVPMELGDAVILSKDCLHASMPNLSDRPRVSVDYRFFGEATGSSKHYLDLAEDRIVERVYA